MYIVLFSYVFRLSFDISYDIFPVLKIVNFYVVWLIKVLASEHFVWDRSVFPENSPPFSCRAGLSLLLRAEQWRRTEGLVCIVT